MAKGALMISCSSCLVAVMAAIVKWAGHAFSSEFLMLVRWTAGLGIFAGLYLARRRPLPWRTGRPVLMAFSAFCFVLAVLFLYLAVRYYPLALVVLLGYISPFLAPALGVVFLGRRESPRAWLGIAVGFAGVALALNPWAGGGVHGVPWLGFFSGLFMSLAIMCNSELIRSESKEAISFYNLFLGFWFCLAVVALTGVEAPHWQKILFPPSRIPAQWLDYAGSAAAVAALGLCTIGVPLLSTGGLKYGTLGQIGSFRFLGPILAGFLDWFLWGVVPGWNFWTGFVLIGLGASLAMSAPSLDADQPARPIWHRLGDPLGLFHRLHEARVPKGASHTRLMGK